MSDLKSKRKSEVPNVDINDLIAEIDSALDQINSLNSRRKLLTNAIDIFKSDQSEEREKKIGNWKAEAESQMSSLLKQETEYLSALDSAPLV